MMKQYTTPEQTAKLIELGFDNPKTPNFYSVGATWVKCEGNYSIGELIEMLPKKIEMNDDKTGELEVSFGSVCMVYYTSSVFIYYDTEAKELIDALYEMIVKLKEEEII